MIFINLPVADLPRSMAFYAALGFTNEPKFTDETAACMVWSETIYVMLLTHAKWQSFTDRPITTDGSSALRLCLSLESREAVETMNRVAGESGGTADADPATDYGFMTTRSFADPDGHIWEPMWMDPAAAEQGPPAEVNA
ncbi:VOC family protein [Croceicoccus naphthovorans]|nr:lactoylglutathione lyase [Croceicoccus naphthovorans]